MGRKINTSVFSRSPLLTMAMFVSVSSSFGFYVYSEKQIDHANELRYRSYLLADDSRPRPNGQAVALLELMRQTGFTDAEFAKLAQAKARSDALTETEFAAMALIESSSPTTEANRLKASLYAARLSLSPCQGRHHEADWRVLRDGGPVHLSRRPTYQEFGDAGSRLSGLAFYYGVLGR